MAKALNKRNDYLYFMEVLYNKNVFVSSTGFMQAPYFPTGTGKHISPLCLGSQDDDYTKEKRMAIFVFVQHDVEGLNALHGGNVDFAINFFRTGLLTIPSNIEGDNVSQTLAG